MRVPIKVSIVFDLHAKLKSAIKNNKKYKILSILRRLEKFKLTVRYLEVTLIGRTINFLKKTNSGDIRNLALKLLNHWKALTRQDILLEQFIRSTERIRV